MLLGACTLAIAVQNPIHAILMLISAFNLFYLLETQEIFMEVARGKWSVHDISRAHRVQIESSHPGFPITRGSNSCYLPCFITSTS